MLPLPATTEETAKYEEMMRERQRHAIYPSLLGTPLKAPMNVVYSRRRQASGLTAVAIRQDALTDQQRLELGEFRLHQYALWGWYEIPTLASNGIATDPALPSLPAETIHVLVGGTDARLLAYFCMQPASHIQSPTGQLLGELLETPGKPRTPTTLRDPWRPLFCLEVESFGPDVFPSLPALASLPVQTMRELSCLIRNQAVNSPLSTIATLEAVYSMTHVVMQPESAIEATLGCIDVEARRVTAVLGMPFLYAPLAPVILEQFEYYWASGFVNAPGRFWPFVIATEDLHKHADHFEMLDHTLSGSAWEIRRTLIQLHRNPPQTIPRAFVPSADETEVFWTADPNYEQPLLKTATDPATVVVPREVR